MTSTVMLGIVNADNMPPSRRHATGGPEAGVGLSVPVNVKVAGVTGATPPGPPVISVTGGELSTITIRVVVAEFPARSVAVAPSVCEPSGIADVSHMAVAVAPGAGRDGSTVLLRAWPATLSTSAATELPLSRAWAWRLTLSRTWLPRGGAWKSSVG